MDGVLPRIYLLVSSMIPLRSFGKTDVKISALGLGEHHLAAAKDEPTAGEIVHPAMDGGITFYGNWLGVQPRQVRRLVGQGSSRDARSRFPHDEGRTHGRDASLAMQMLEQSLRRLQTDQLDLWQVYGVTFPEHG